jgi:hypothetical protein
LSVVGLLFLTRAAGSGSLASTLNATRDYLVAPLSVVKSTLGLQTVECWGPHVSTEDFGKLGEQQLCMWKRN